MISETHIQKAVQHFEALIRNQATRLEALSHSDWIQYNDISPLIIGICPGDGIGIEISKHASTVLHHLLQKEIASGKVAIKLIEGLTIENRVAQNKAIPDDVLAELKSCHVILKGPTTTPQKGDNWPNIESANVAMRRELDLFANVRPVKVPEINVDWTFFRENTEGAYILGSKGIDIGDDMSFDFTVATQAGCERIIQLAFEFAKKTNKCKVTVITKSNVIKTTDGRFSATAKQIAQQYPGISLDEWYIDIMTAKLLDPARRSEFGVMVMPNLYGDILTDEAAQIQGGVGTAGSANIGKKWAMFEAIHGSAPRMVKEGRAQYADPCSMIKAAAMLLQHVGYGDKAQKIEKSLDLCTQYEKKLSITGREDGATAEAFTRYLLDWVNDTALDSTWGTYTQS